MSDAEKYQQILEIARTVNKQLRAEQKNAGTYENPVNTDMVKTIKSMFYERVVEIIKT